MFRIRRKAPSGHRLGAGRGAGVLAVALAFATGWGALAQDRPTPPDGPETARLVWSTLIALDHANRTGNYTVLRDLGAPEFRAANDAARLATIFARIREQDLGLGRTVLDVPVYAEPPRLTEDGRFLVSGSFAGRPQGLRFELVFRHSAGEWRIFGITLAPLPAAEPPGAEETPATESSSN